MTDVLDFKQFLAEQLGVIDEMLAISGMPASDRALFASLEFVKVCIVDAKGVSLEDPLKQPWFAHLHAMVKTWYRGRYGEDGFRPAEPTAVGVVLVFSTPFRLEIPLTLLKPADRADQAWLCFVATVHEGEQPLSWIINGPDITRMTPAEAADLEATTRGVAAANRLIAVDLMSAERPTPEVAATLGRIRPQLDAAVGHLCSFQGAEKGLAVWELQLATEFALKALVLERTGGVDRTHDLAALHTAACAVGMTPLSSEVLTMFPRWKDAIRFRYGENGDPCVRWCFEHYRRTIGAVAHIVAAHRRKFVFRDSEFLIQVPPWEKPAPALAR